jgi:ABC-type dipeptide/oligopeptide/nickel transport system permease component
MTRYILRRTVLLVPVRLGITLCTFALLKTLPGDPVLSLVGERASPETIALMREHLGTDRGLLAQYRGYLGLILRGDFGSLLAAVPLGVAAGFLSAFFRGRMTERCIDGCAMAALSVPVFWSAIIIMMVMSLRLKWFPPSGTGGLRFLVLPCLVLAIPAMATLCRVTKTAVTDVLRMPCILTAKAKGLSQVSITAVHVLKNAVIPIVTVIGLDFGSYLNGAVVTETIFGWDGIGRFTMEGIIKRDYPVIMGCILIGTVTFVVVNLVTDLLYHALDPRIRIHVKDR